MRKGWPDLIAGFPWIRGEGTYPIPAYSEFMPPPRVGRKACGEIDRAIFVDGDESGWHVSDREEMYELRPGLAHLTAHLLKIIHHLGHGDPAHGLARNKLQNNSYWPIGLRAPEHERYVVLMTLALTRTQDDKGRVRWTLFGGSEHGPDSAFKDAGDFFARVVKSVYGETDGFHEGVPKSLKNVRYILTFDPFTQLPQNIRDAYLHGDVHLLPFPGSLVFWGVAGYARLQLPGAMQIPLLQAVDRRESPGGLRVPQSGWFHEKTPRAPEPHPHVGPYRQTFRRTHRWAKVRRDEDELDLIAPSEDQLIHVLFSTNPDELGLYGKPMARNVQLWTADHEPLLDGPAATPAQIRAAAERVRAGGSFGYRFLYPPMQVGTHPVFWHRAIAGFIGPAGEPQIIPDAPLGFLDADGIDLEPRIDKPLPPAPLPPPKPSPPLTFAQTATPAFEAAYGKTIEMLAMGDYLNKDNADVALDRVTQRHLQRRERDLDPLAQMLVDHHRGAGLEADPMPFRWQTDFPFDWSEGWKRNQEGAGAECDVIARVPGRNRKRAVIMADHFDTAYMEDVYGYPKGGGPRLAAHGADDNCSATATLMLAAPIFLALSRAGQLACDIWLAHLTGEEFPSDCLGARALVQRIVEGTLPIEIAGVFVLDMIAHNNVKHRDLFQISPGEGARALALAAHAEEAARLWRALPSGLKVRGEVRRHDAPHSTLYNTDGQIFSDAGLPVVLFMENYDIDRKGYHDSHDTMENIDLDYGAAVAAIAIETVARVAAEG